MTLHLIDANALIQANEDYYPLDRIPPFWDWLLQQCLAGSIKMPVQIYNEVAPGRGILPEWMREDHVRDALVLDELTDIALVQHVIEHGYGTGLTDVDVSKIGQDPFLIAAALAGEDRLVVTKEVSKPTLTGANRRIPDVCAGFGLTVITDFELYRRLNFTIK